MNDNNLILDFSKVIFPIVTFSENASMYFGRNEDDILICSKSSLKNGFYKNLKVIDSSGFLYQINGAKKIGTVGGFWGYNIFFNQRLRVSLFVKKFNDDRQTFVRLRDFKNLFINTMTANQEIWNGDGLIKKRVDFVNDANSHIEITRKFCTDFHKTY